MFRCPGNGFTLTGAGSGNGIECSNIRPQGVEVRNGTVCNFTTGIWMLDCDYLRISGVRAVGSADSGARQSIDEDSDMA